MLLLPITSHQSQIIYREPKSMKLREFAAKEAGYIKIKKLPDLMHDRFYRFS
jgi:hypothetical protein